ncbi:MAG: methyltransferase domain-containing protein [Alphaproteobacteria bacterium]
MGWDPAAYLRYDDFRTRPAADLLARVPLQAPALIYDLGCGPGNSTALLRARWPEARIIGIDGSPEMLARARRDGPQAEWEKADLSSFIPGEPADLLFSNAAYHWVPNRVEIFPRLMDRLKPGGVLAVQMPANFEAPSHRVIRETAALKPWAERFEGMDRPAGIEPPDTYYDLLSDAAAHIDLWTTEYLHPLTGPDPVLNWVKGTALTPYLGRLEGTGLTDGFLQACAERLRAAYPPRADGVTLFPFRRLFFVAPLVEKLKSFDDEMTSED